jgi:hypothetical protein
MHVIQPNCRNHLTAGDIDFLVSALADTRHESAFLTSLLSDDAARDQILDNPELIKAIQDSDVLLKISSCLYFYLLVRHSLLKGGIESRQLADYVAEMLAEFSDYHRAVTPLQDSVKPYEYLVDLVESAASPNREVAFAVNCHLGNYTLFLSGLFPDRIVARQKTKAAPGIDYFEKMGRTGFHAASKLHMAAEFDLEKLLEELSVEFHAVRLALNAMTQRYLFTAPVPCQIIAA